MTIPERHLRRPCTIRPEQNAREAAREMEAAHAGALIVVDEQDRPVGVLTDRDVALRVLAERRAAEECLVGECMSEPALTLERDASLSEAAARMRKHRVRRLPIVDEEGRLVGMLTADDLLEHSSTELTLLVEAMRRSVAREADADLARASVLGEE